MLSKKTFKIKRKNKVIKTLDTDFLPSTLSIIETSASNFPRIAATVIILLSLTALAWSYFGKIDVVATASGKIIPNSKSKSIQSLQTANVKQILAFEGKKVKQGDLLISLDNTQISAEQESLLHDYKLALLQKERTNALLQSIKFAKTPYFVAPKSLALPDLMIDKSLYFESLEWIKTSYQEYISKMTQSDAQIQQKQAEIISLNAQINKLQQTLVLSKRQEADYQKLAEENAIPIHSYLQKQQTSIESQQDLIMSKSKINEIKAQIQQIISEKQNIKSQITSQSFASFNEEIQKISQLEQNIIKIKNQKEATEIFAPITGTVQQLAINTINGVVTPAQVLMMIIPKNENLEIEAFIENKDIGFINIGNKVAVKIDTFPYTKYGLIEGEIISISQDAIQDEKRGLIYSLRIKMLQNYVTDKDGKKQIKLSAGMTAQCDIKTKERRLIEYFLSPLIDYQKSSFKER